MYTKRLFNGFQRRKIERLISQHGGQYSFSRYPKNAYNEPVKTAVPSSHDLKGFFYTQNNQKGYWLLNTTDETRTRYERYLTHFVLVLYDDFAQDPIKLDDELVLNNAVYRVTGHQNIQEADFAVNISLDMVIGESRET